MINKEELMKKFVLSRFGIGASQKYNDFVLVLLKEEAFELFEDIEQLEETIKMLKDWFRFKVTKFNNLDGTFRYVLEYKVGLSDYGIILTQEQYELLKRVFESVGKEYVKK